MCHKEIEIKTKIDGLDVLLNWDKKGYNPGQSPKNSLLIVLRGTRGISKVNLAMEMMLGISDSFGTVKHTRFYSLDKDNAALLKKCKNFNEERTDLDEIFLHPKDEKETSYLYTKMLQFNAIVQDIHDIPEKEPENCIVIDGFAGLGMDDFKRLPMDALEESLRKKSHVSILVFDDRLTNYSTGADIIIELRKTCNEDHNYTYFELQIAKNFLRTATNGWHKYRCTEKGNIVVYPSIHKFFSSSSVACEKFKQQVLDTPHFAPCKGIGDSSMVKILLDDILHAKQGTVTSIIGANNTFKRRLSAVSIAKKIMAKERVLVFLLNEEPSNFMELIRSATSKYRIDKPKLHLFEMPMGGFSPDEVLDMIMQYAKKYNNDILHLYIVDMASIDYAFPLLQKETLFMPALANVCKQENISLTVICNKNFSQVDELCSVSDAVLVTLRENTGEILDKDENGNSLSIKKDKNADKLTIYLEKNPFGKEHNSRVYQMDIDNINTYDTPDSILQKQFDTEICTNKDFWRQSWNIKNIVRTRNEQ